MRRSRLRRTVIVLLMVLGLGVVTGAVVSGVYLYGAGVSSTVITAIMVLAVWPLATVWVLLGLLESHFVHDIERLRADVLIATADAQHQLPASAPDHGSDLEPVRQAVARLVTTLTERLTLEQARLKGVLATSDDGILVLTHEGQVTLVNRVAKVLLGHDGLTVGTSVFNVLERSQVVAAMEEAITQNRAINFPLCTLAKTPLEAKLVPHSKHGGVVVRLRTAEGQLLVAPDANHPAPHPEMVEVDFSLHATLPPVGFGPETPLEALPVMVMDTETTGLEATTDRVVAIGAVRVHGRQLFSTSNLDVLVNPGQPIPAASSKVHGIRDAMVADAPDLKAHWPEVTALLEGCVLVGHNIAFDVAVLRAECQRLGLVWPEVPTLDTFLLAGSLLDGQTDLNLEVLAERLGVDVHGRHTALGDSLVTAEVYTKLLPLLQAQGINTLAEALAFSQQNTALVAKQKAMGW